MVSHLHPICHLSPPLSGQEAVTGSGHEGADVFVGRESFLPATTCHLHKSVGWPPLLNSLVLGLGCFQEADDPPHSPQPKLEHSYPSGLASSASPEAVLSGGLDFSSVS